MSIPLKVNTDNKVVLFELIDTIPINNLPPITQVEETFTAGEILGGQRLVVLISGKVYLFDPTIDSNADRIIGFTKTSAILNGSVVVIKEGIVNSLSLVQNNTYYGVASGLITSTIPTSGILIRVGIALDSSTLQINKSEPIILI